MIPLEGKRKHGLCENKSYATKCQPYKSSKISPCALNEKITFSWILNPNIESICDFGRNSHFIHLLRHGVCDGYVSFQDSFILWWEVMLVVFSPLYHKP